MPHYIYICSSCQEQQEIFHSIEEIIEECPLCGEETMNKVPSFRRPTITKDKTGQVVKDFIKSAKEELEAEKILKKERQK